MSWRKGERNWRTRREAVRWEADYEISMEFVDGSRARVGGVTIMHGPCADRHVGGWVAARGVEAPRSRCTESRDISHYAFLSGGRHYFTYCRRRRTDCLCQFFHPAKKERPAIWSRNTRIAARTPPQRYSLEFNRIRSPSAIKKNMYVFEEIVDTLCKEDIRVYLRMRVCMCVGFRFWSVAELDIRHWWNQPFHILILGIRVELICLVDACNSFSDMMSLFSLASSL